METAGASARGTTGAAPLPTYARGCLQALHAPEELVQRICAGGELTLQDLQRCDTTAALRLAALTTDDARCMSRLQPLILRTGPLGSEDSSQEGTSQEGTRQEGTRQEGSSQVASPFQFPQFRSAVQRLWRVRGVPFRLYFEHGTPRIQVTPEPDRSSAVAHGPGATEAVYGPGAEEVVPGAEPGPEPETEPGVEAHPIYLLPHQLRAVKLLQSTARRNPQARFGICGALAVLRMGLGKTVVAMAHAFMLPRPPDYGSVHGTHGFPALIVASKTVMTMWQLDGFEKFLVPGSVRILYLHSDWTSEDAIQRLDRQTVCSYDVVVTTYDVVRNLAAKWPETQRDCVLEYGRAGVWNENPNSVKRVHARQRADADHPEWTGIRVLYGTPWEVVVSDESQRFANHETKTFRAMMGLYGRHKLCLTGTPVRNYKTDLWAQFRWLGYTGVDQPNRWHQYCMKMHDLHACIVAIDYADTNIVMPPQASQRHSIHFTPFEQAVYDFVRAKAREALDLMLQNKLSFVCVLALFTRLRQVCIAPYLLTIMSKRGQQKRKTPATHQGWGGGSGRGRGFGQGGGGGATRTAAQDTGFDASVDSYVGQVMAEMAADGPMWSIIKNKEGPGGIQSSKIQAILGVLQRIPPGDKVLVFSMFTSVLDLIASALPPAQFAMLDGDVKDRVGVLRAFKTDPQCKVLFVTYGVGGEGINMTEGNHVICVEPWWTYAVPDQAKARCWRPGQAKTVTMYDIVVENSIEQHILEVCVAKSTMARSFLGDKHLSSLSETVNAASTHLTADMLKRILR